ncbi:hypothetical protein [Streptomyces sp. NPDC015345]
MRELADRLRDGAESGELEAGLDHESIARECAARDCGPSGRTVAAPST